MRNEIMYKRWCIHVSNENKKKIFKFDIPQNPRHKLKNDNLLLLYTSVDEQRNMENMIYVKGIFVLGK